MKPIHIAKLLPLTLLMRCVRLTVIYLPLPVPTTGCLKTCFMIIFLVLTLFYTLQYVPPRNPPTLNFSPLSDRHIHFTKKPSQFQ